METNVERTEKAYKTIRTAVEKVLADVGGLDIGSPGNFPYGWRKAGKGRSVWRLVEEIIVQGLEARRDELDLIEVTPADSEVGVYDVAVIVGDPAMTCYINIKAAAHNGRAQKDDISKARKLRTFYDNNPNDQLFLATIYIEFTSADGALRVDFRQCNVLPIAWIPDIYVNPSNNGNLQSSKYRQPNLAVKRSNEEFVFALQQAIDVADSIRENKFASRQPEKE